MSYACVIDSSIDPSESAIDILRRSVLALENRLARLESADRSQPFPASVATVSMTPTSPVPPSTKGKVRAQAAPTPSKAKPAKKAKPTKKGPAIPSNPLPLHLAQTFPQEGKPDRHLVTVAIPDASAAHVVGQGGKGLKQIHDISGARVSAYVLAEGSREERHVSIRGTDEQIGDALVVLGKRIARKRIHTPKPKKTLSTPAVPPAAARTGAPASPLAHARGGPSAPPVAAQARPPARPSAPPPVPSFQPTISLHPPSPRHGSPIPVSRTPSWSGGWGVESLTPPSVQMASPSPNPTPHASTVVMGSPSPSGSSTPSSPMQIGVLDTDPGSATPRRRQTARRGGGPPKGS